MRQFFFERKFNRFDFYAGLIITIITVEMSNLWVLALLFPLSVISSIGEGGRYD